MRPLLRKSLCIAGGVVGVGAALLLAGGAVVAAKVLARRPLEAVPSTTHPSIPRRGCIECHVPIAEEWRESFHHKSLTGPYWADVRRLGYASILERFRKRCVDCHAPANVLDLTVPASTAPGDLGVECTPNLLREPEGVVPAARSDDAELGVDCVACHVSRRGILGPGHRPTSAHEVLADERFQDPGRAAGALCQVCHRAAVEAWRKTRFAAEGVACLDCHMPMVRRPSVAGGPERLRRSHRFPADKDEAMLRGAVGASLRVGSDGAAIFTVANRGVGHHLPSGGNYLSVRLEARDDAGRLLRDKVEYFGRDEALLLDFWPFADGDNRIPAGEQRQVRFDLPDGHGTVGAVVRYHDWAGVRPTVVALKERY